MTLHYLRCLKATQTVSESFSESWSLKKVTYISNRTRLDFHPLSFQLLDVPTGYKWFIQKVIALWVPCCTWHIFLSQNKLNSMYSDPEGELHRARRRCTGDVLKRAAAQLTEFPKCILRHAWAANHGFAWSSLWLPDPKGKERARGDLCNSVHTDYRTIFGRSSVEHCLYGIRWAVWHETLFFFLIAAVASLKECAGDEMLLFCLNWCSWKC